jgi:N-methylhydantoinase A/oxoprolinase/acetone carboxylase beta subunit
MSHRIAPVLGELGRLNAVVIHAYAAEQSRDQFRKLESEFKSKGYRGSVFIFTNYGTLVPIEYERLVHTVSSGPAGGATAVKHLADVYGFEYVVGIDVGGTSLDVSSILAGQPVIDPTTIVERFETAVPSIRVESIGAGTGSFVRIDPVTKGLRIGPDSAGYRIGVSWRDGGIENVTVNDAMVVLGYINPDYFLGGDVKLDRKHAIAEFEEQIASKLGIDPYEAAWGVYQMISDHMKLHVESIVRGLGFSPENFYLVTYGGGGPLMVASITKGMKFAGILVPELAPAFSAYGTTLSDLGIRAESSVEVYVPPPPGVTPVGIAVDIMKGIAQMLGMELELEEGEILEGMKNMLYMNAVGRLSEVWTRLESYVKEEFEKAGISEEEISWRAAVRMLYAGMLDDVEVESPTHQATETLIAELSEKFDDLFARVYASSARSREFGYVITRAILTGFVKVTKPELREYPVADREPVPEAFKGEREIYWDGKWYNARIYEMGLLQPGNEIEGAAVLEAPATTMVIPPGMKVILDRRRVFWLSEGDIEPSVRKIAIGGE